MSDGDKECTHFENYRVYKFFESDQPSNMSLNLLNPIDKVVIPGGRFDLYPFLQPILVITHVALARVFNGYGFVSFSVFPSNKKHYCSKHSCSCSEKHMIDSNVSSTGIL